MDHAFLASLCSTMTNSTIPKLEPGCGRITASLHGHSVVLSELSSAYPLKIISPRVLSRPDVAIAYILSYGGGLVGGAVRIPAHCGRRLAWSRSHRAEGPSLAFYPFLKNLLNCIPSGGVSAVVSVPSFLLPCGNRYPLFPAAVFVVRCSFVHLRC